MHIKVTHVPKRYHGFSVIVHQFFEPVAQKLVAMKFNFASNSKLYRAPLLIHFPAIEEPFLSQTHAGFIAISFGWVALVALHVVQLCVSFTTATALLCTSFPSSRWMLTTYCRLPDIHISTVHDFHRWRIPTYTLWSHTPCECYIYVTIMNLMFPVELWTKTLFWPARAYCR